jgi:hypothetical protein
MMLHSYHVAVSYCQQLKRLLSEIEVSVVLTICKTFACQIQGDGGPHPTRRPGVAYERYRAGHRPMQSSGHELQSRRLDNSFDAAHYVFLKNYKRSYLSSEREHEAVRCLTDSLGSHCFRIKRVSSNETAVHIPRFCTFIKSFMIA